MGEINKMAIMINNNGDDLFLDRLLFSLAKAIPSPVVDIIPMNKRVYRITTVKAHYILKGFSSLQRLKAQELFTKKLKESGFLKTYSFFNSEFDFSFEMNGVHYGLIEYLPSSKIIFSFRKHSDREEGLHLLQQYHDVSSDLLSSFDSVLAHENIIERWKKRLQTFIENKSFISLFIENSILDEIVDWSIYALKNLEGYLDGRGRDVILHGDLVDHNFLRHLDGTLMLIDFDLISIGNEMHDFLHYAQRIMPYLNWSLAELMQYDAFDTHMEQHFFRNGLLFPTDILREWNRVIRERQFHVPQRMRPVISLTMNQYFVRKQFFEKMTGEKSGRN